MTIEGGRIDRNPAEHGTGSSWPASDQGSGRNQLPAPDRPAAVRGQAPTILTACGRSDDEQLAARLVRDLGARGFPLADAEDLRRRMEAGQADLVLADSAIGPGPLDELLGAVADSPEADDLPILLVVEPGDLGRLAERWADRLHCVLLRRPVGSGQLLAAVRSGLRFRARLRQNRALVAELAAANAELERQRAQADEEALQKTRFLAAVSHDIRTPVNAMVLSCQLLRAVCDSGADAAEIHSLTDGLLRSSGALVELVNDLLDIARYDQGKLTLIETEFRLGELIGRTVDGLRPLAERKGLALEVCVETPDAVIRTDSIKLSRVLQNLLTNAIKFTDSGRVAVEARAGRDAGVEIRVVDTGCGIPDALQESIFDEFRQLRNPERDRSKGSGLGLAICRRLITALGGTIRVATPPGHAGSVFALELGPGHVLADDLGAGPASGPG